MIHPWEILLLNTPNVGEFFFSYNKRNVSVTIRVDNIGFVWAKVTTPYFAWGCNKVKAKVKNNIIKYYLMKISNELLEYNVKETFDGYLQK